MKTLRSVVQAIFILALSFQIQACSSAKPGAQAGDPDESPPLPAKYLSKSIIKTDSTGDGVFDSTDTFYYNVNRQITLSETDDDQDGIVDSTVEYTYDDNGNLIVESDRGNLDYDYFYTYDANNNQIMVEQDKDFDGTINSVSEYFYNAANKVTQYRYDSNYDGIPDRITNNEYDPTGLLLVKIEADTNGDGIPNNIVTRTYNAAGLLESDSYDTDGNGVANNIYYYAYNSSGKVTEETVDFGANFSIDQKFTYEYDADGSLILEKRDNDNNGVIDTKILTTYQTLPEAVVIKGIVTTSKVNHITEYRNSADVLTARFEYTYNADTNDFRYSGDSDGNGIIDFYYGTRYDEFFNEIENYRDNNNDGVYEYHTVFENFYEDVPE